MHYSQRLFIISYLLIAATISHAMQDHLSSYLHSCQEITAVKNPKSVRYITPDIVAISSSNECSVVDLKTKLPLCINKVAQRWYYVDFPLLYTHNKKVISFIGQKVVMYDTQTSVKKAFLPQQEEIVALAVHPRNDEVFLSYANKKLITQYNYLTGTAKNGVIPGHGYVHMAIHPTKEVMCRANCAGGIFVHSLDDFSKAHKIFALPRARVCQFLQYSPDGLRIVIGNHEELYVTDPDNKSDQNISLKHGQNEQFNAIAFHPQGLLATLSTRKTVTRDKKVIIRYWNVHTGNILHTSSEWDSHGAHDFSFSDDGFEVIVVLEDKCVRALVPFVVKEKCIYLLFWLNKIKEQGTLSQDIVGYCIKIFLRYLSF